MSVVPKIVGLICFVGSVWGCTVGGSGPPPELEGAEIYRRTCATCHQADGQGVPGTFPPLVDAPWVTGDPETAVRIVVGGMAGPLDVNGRRYRGLMPAHVPLTDESIARVLTYVRTSWGNQASAVDAMTVQRIRAGQRGRTEPWTVESLEAARR